MYSFEVRKLIMLRTTTLCLLLVGFLIVKAQNFENYPSNSSVTECNAIEGNLQNCVQCYMCDGNFYQYKASKKNHTLHKITLYDSNCQPKEFCCHSQIDFSARNEGDCGRSEPAGYPRGVRKSLRSVLQGQYPWRTWIFSEGSTKPLCAGVYINYSNRAIITSATCVDNYTAQQLRVGFTRSDGNIHVNEIHKYNEDTRTNDIAVIILSPKDALSPWAHVACLPSTRPVFQTSCIAVSDQDFNLNTVVPNQISCGVDNRLDVTKICSVVTKGDYIPEVGGGMFCEQETSLFDVNYVVNGIHLYQNNNISLYTNVSHYVSWIDKTLDAVEKKAKYV